MASPIIKREHVLARISSGLLIGGVFVALAILAIAATILWMLWAPSPALPGNAQPVATSTPAPSILPYDSGIQGTITTGPTCPPEQYPPSPACADKPYATLVAIYHASDAVHAVALLRSDASGYYKASLPPGAYMVHAGESNLPRCTSVSMTVAATGYTTADISCDTGIR